MHAIEKLQAILVDRFKRRALAHTLVSPRAEAWTLTGYLWAEEGAEGLAVGDALRAEAPPWLRRMLTRQLEDEARHAALLRARLVALGRPARDPSAAAGAVLRAKVRRLERLCARAAPRFERGAIVPLLACAARLEATGARVFARHVEVHAAHGREDDTTRALRALLDDERRHARSCAAALGRLVAPAERPALAALEDEVARVDRALGVSTAAATWVVTTALRLRDAAARSAA